MRILHLTKYLPRFYGGIEYVTHQMVQAGQRAGAQVTLIGVEPGKGHNRFEAIGKQVGLRSWQRVGPVELAPRFLADLRLSDYDVVHVHLPHPLAELGVLRYQKQLASTQLVPVFHAPITRIPVLSKVYYQAIQAPLLRRSAAILSASVEILRNHPWYSSFERQAVPIPFPTEQPRVVALSSAQDDVERPPFILAVGRLVPYKGFDYLVKAMMRVEPTWHLKIIGEGPMKAELQQLISDLRLGSRVELCGMVDDTTKDRLYAECSLFTMPSVTDQEGFGMVLAEAFAYRKPAVVSQIPTGVSFLARKGGCGATVAPRDLAGLAEALNAMIHSPQERRARGAENYRFWQRELSPSTFLHRYQCLLSAVTGEPLVSKAPDLVLDAQTQSVDDHVA